MSTLPAADTSPLQQSQGAQIMHSLDYDELDFDSRDAIDAQDLADALDLLDEEYAR